MADDDTRGGQEGELGTQGHEPTGTVRRGGVIVTRDAPDTVAPEGAATPGAVLSDPGANDTIRPEVLADSRSRDAERDGDVGRDVAPTPARARLPLGLFGLLAGLVTVAAATVAVATSRLHLDDW